MKKVSWLQKRSQLVSILYSSLHNASCPVPHLHARSLYIVTQHSNSWAACAPQTLCFPDKAKAPFHAPPVVDRPWALLAHSTSTTTEHESLVARNMKT